MEIKIFSEGTSMEARRNAVEIEIPPQIQICDWNKIEVHNSIEFKWSDGQQSGLIGLEAKGNCKLLVRSSKDATTITVGHNTQLSELRRKCWLNLFFTGWTSYVQQLFTSASALGLLRSSCFSHGVLSLFPTIYSRHHHFFSGYLRK